MYARIHALGSNGLYMYYKILYDNYSVIHVCKNYNRILIYQE